MWKDFKFAIDPRSGDSKPVPKEGSDDDDEGGSKSGSKSLLHDGGDTGYDEAKKLGEDEDHYASFNDNLSTTKSTTGKA